MRLWDWFRSVQPLFEARLAESRVIVRNQCPLAHRRSEEHTSELQSQSNLVCRLLLEKKKTELLAEAKAAAAQDGSAAARLSRLSHLHLALAEQDPAVALVRLVDPAHSHHIRQRAVQH